jgi:hypothetical protein
MAKYNLDTFALYHRFIMSKKSAISYFDALIPQSLPNTVYIIYPPHGLTR